MSNSTQYIKVIRNLSAPLDGDMTGSDRVGRGIAGRRLEQQLVKAVLADSALPTAHYDTETI